MDTASLKLADAPDLHSRCWLQGVVGWMMVTSLLLGIAINISSAILSITHPLSGATSSELKEFGASADSVRILVVQICSWIAAGLAIVSLGIFTKAVKSSYNTWKTLFLFFALLSFLTQVATFCLMFSTGVALDNLFTFKQVELSDYMDANPSFTFKDPGASAKEFNCMWNEFACQLGTGNALNSACSGDVSLGQDISCTSAVKAGSTGQVDAAMVEKSLNEVCGSTGLLHGKLKRPSGKCEACVNESLGFGLAAVQPSAVLCGCFQSFTDFFREYGSPWYGAAQWRVLGSATYLLVSFISYIGVMIMMVKYYGGWHFHKWYDVSDTETLAEAQARIEARRAGVAQRRLEEQQGMLLDVKKQFRMEVKRNSGLGWYRSLQYIFHNISNTLPPPPPSISQGLQQPPVAADPTSAQGAAQSLPATPSPLTEPMSRPFVRSLVSLGIRSAWFVLLAHSLLLAGGVSPLVGAVVAVPVVYMTFRGRFATEQREDARKFVFIAASLLVAALALLVLVILHDIAGISLPAWVISPFTGGVMVEESAKGEFMLSMVIYPILVCAMSLQVSHQSDLIAYDSRVAVLAHLLVRMPYGDAISLLWISIIYGLLVPIVDSPMATSVVGYDAALLEDSGGAESMVGGALKASLPVLEILTRVLYLPLVTLCIITLATPVAFLMLMAVLLAPPLRKKCHYLVPALYLVAVSPLPQMFPVVLVSAVPRVTPVELSPLAAVAALVCTTRKLLERSGAPQASLRFLPMSFGSPIRLALQLLLWWLVLRAVVTSSRVDRLCQSVFFVCTLIWQLAGIRYGRTFASEYVICNSAVLGALVSFATLSADSGSLADFQAAIWARCVPVLLAASVLWALDRVTLVSQGQQESRAGSMFASGVAAVLMAFLYAALPLLPSAPLRVLTITMTAGCAGLASLLSLVMPLRSAIGWGTGLAIAFAVGNYVLGVMQGESTRVTAQLCWQMWFLTASQSVAFTPAIPSPPSLSEGMQKLVAATAPIATFYFSTVRGLDHPQSFPIENLVLTVFAVLAVSLPRFLQKPGRVAVVFSIIHLYALVVTVSNYGIRKAPLSGVIAHYYPLGVCVLVAALTPTGFTEASDGIVALANDYSSPDSYRLILLVVAVVRPSVWSISAYLPLSFSRRRSEAVHKLAILLLCVSVLELCVTPMVLSVVHRPFPVTPFHQWLGLSWASAPIAMMTNYVGLALASVVLHEKPVPLLTPTKLVIAFTCLLAVELLFDRRRSIGVFVVLMLVLGLAMLLEIPQSGRAPISRRCLLIVSASYYILCVLSQIPLNLVPDKSQFWLYLQDWLPLFLFGEVPSLALYELCAPMLYLLTRPLRPSSPDNFLAADSSTIADSWVRRVLLRRCQADERKHKANLDTLLRRLNRIVAVAGTMDTAEDHGGEEAQSRRMPERSATQDAEKISGLAEKFTEGQGAIDDDQIEEIALYLGMSVVQVKADLTEVSEALPNDTPAEFIISTVLKRLVVTGSSEAEIQEKRDDILAKAKEELAGNNQAQSAGQPSGQVTPSSSSTEAAHRSRRSIMAAENVTGAVAQTTDAVIDGVTMVLGGQNVNLPRASVDGSQGGRRHKRVNIISSLLHSFNYNVIDPALKAHPVSAKLPSTLQFLLSHTAIWVAIALFSQAVAYDASILSVIPLGIMLCWLIPAAYPFLTATPWIVVGLCSLGSLSLKLVMQMPHVCDTDGYVPSIVESRWECPPTYGVVTPLSRLGLFKVSDYEDAALLSYVGWDLGIILLVVLHLIHKRLSGRGADMTPAQAKVILRRPEDAEGRPESSEQDSEGASGHAVSLRRPSLDLFIPRFAFSLVVIFLIIFDWSAISSASTDKLETGFAESVRNNRFSTVQVLAIVGLIVRVLVDRYIYSRLSTSVDGYSFGRHVLTEKLILWAQVVLMLAGCVYIRTVPLRVVIPFTCYLVLTGIQLHFAIRVSHPGLVWLGSIPPTRDPNDPTKPIPPSNGAWFSYYTYRVYRVIPFLDELRVICDFASSRGTALSLFMWFKLEDAWQNLYLVHYDIAGRAAIERQTSPKYRFLLGGSVLAFLVFVITGPLTFFSGLNLLRESNMVTSASMAISLKVGELSIPVWKTDHVGLRVPQSSEYPLMPEELVSYTAMHSADLQNATLPKAADVLWQPSPPLRRQIRDYIQANQTPGGEVNATFCVTWEFGHSQPGSVRSSGYHCVQSVQPAQQLLDAMSLVNGSQLHIEGLIPRALYLNGPWANPPGSFRQFNNVSLKVEKEDSQVWWAMADNPTLALVSERAVPPSAGGGASASSSLSVIGLYLGVVLTIGRFFRLVIQDSSKRIMFEELPSVTYPLQLCQGVQIARMRHSLEAERVLYYEVVTLYRSPAKLMSVTGSTSQMPDVLVSKQSSAHAAVRRRARPQQSEGGSAEGGDRDGAILPAANV
ncbi:hypothetical protein FOZ60_009570 [Perkinsus olseni]|uniref:Piezo non-specific cation channel R-Ras-binding domain-containing protein n=1 Tax=Perkinsus olseni TaxID=32597 RepID=A0A7J6NH98_PEROL|nr:hypothetical protein FOZ60_009570 [Perkinsus olseni]